MTIMGYNFELGDIAINESLKILKTPLPPPPLIKNKRNKWGQTNNREQNDLIDKIKIVLANLCKNNDSEDIKIIKDALCPVVVVDMSMMHLALEKLASK